MNRDGLKSKRAARELLTCWRWIIEDWEEQGKGNRPCYPDRSGGKPRNRRERAAMAECLRDCADELESILEPNPKEHGQA